MNSPDPTKARILTDAEARALGDGLENLLAQLGTGNDKRANAYFVNKKRLSGAGNEAELNALYRTDWLSGKVVDIIPNDMTREWRSFTGDIEPDVIEKLEKEEDRLFLAQAFNQAHKWARLYGTSFIVMSVDDGLDVAKPLDVKAIGEGGLRHIKVLDRTRIHHGDVQVDADPFSVNFGMPELYRIADTSVVVHHSRMLRFDGVMLPYQQFRENKYYSDSVLDRLYEAVMNYNTVANSSASMTYEANVDIIKVKGLMGYLGTAEGEKLLRKRFTLAGVMKSFNNMLLLDSEEAFESKKNSFQGLSALLDAFAKILAAATDIPATRLLGTSASGLNATGEGDMKNYYDMIRSRQKTEYKPLLDYFDTIMAANLGMKDDDLEYKFNSLFQLTDTEQAAVDLSNAQRDQIYLDANVITEDIIAKELQQSDVYSNITDEYIEELEKALKELEEETDGLETDPIEGAPEVTPGEEEIDPATAGGADD